MDTSSTEHDLIHSVLSGNLDDFAPLVRRHQDRVYGLCLSMTRQATEADDLAQEIFLKAYRSLNEFRFESSFSTWLYRVTYRHCLDFLKSRKRRPTQSLDELIENRGERGWGECPPWSDGPALNRLSFDVHAQTEWARHLLDSLDPKDRMVLTLREVQGLSYEELAETLKISLEAVKSRLRRAREALRTSARHFSTPPIVKAVEETP
jgi:RNA polymerase sigma-70 factor (ECF subfamily)